MNGTKNVEYQQKDIALNQWQDVTIKFTGSHDSLKVIFNLDKASTSWWLDTILGDIDLNIYMDNFLVVAKGNEPEPPAGNMKDGLTFENISELDCYTGMNMTVSRVAYEDTNLTLPQGVELGKYALLGTVNTANGNAWPTLKFTCNKATAGWGKISFKVYVECSDTAVQNNNVRYITFSGGSNSFNSSAIPFNQWVDVSILTYYPCTSGNLQFNLTDSSGKAIFNNADLKIYIDNFKMN